MGGGFLARGPIGGRNRVEMRRGFGQIPPIGRGLDEPLHVGAGGRIEPRRGEAQEHQPRRVHLGRRVARRKVDEQMPQRLVPGRWPGQPVGGDLVGDPGGVGQHPFPQAVAQHQPGQQMPARL